MALDRTFVIFDAEGDFFCGDGTWWTDFGDAVQYGRVEDARDAAKGEKQRLYEYGGINLYIAEIVEII